MPEFERRSPMPVPPDALYDWHARPGALERLMPPFDAAEVVEHSGDFASRCVVMRARMLGPVWATLVARHLDAMPGVRFRDVQERGPFSRYEHEHRFEPAPGGSLLVDHIDYELPLGPLGRIFGGAYAAARFDRMFAFRHQRTREDLARHLGANVEPLRFAITGASGLIGTQLGAFLTTGGHTVLPLVRRDAKPGEIRWDPTGGTVDQEALEGVDVVIHLAGENVASRWTEERKKAIMESRALGTRTIATAIAKMKRKPRVFVSCSAIGIYGNTGDTEVDETSPAGGGFLADVCRAWEAAADPAREAGVRVVHPRVGVVLSGNGGALVEMKRPFLFGVGGPVGDGRQWLSWIDMDDVIGALLHLVATDIDGPVNLVAPAPARQAEFATALGKVIHRPSFMPLPAFAVKTIFGKMGEEVLLGGQRVKPTRLVQSGFQFLRPDLEGCMRFQLGR